MQDRGKSFCARREPQIFRIWPNFCPPLSRGQRGRPRDPPIGLPWLPRGPQAPQSVENGSTKSAVNLCETAANLFVHGVSHKFANFGPILTPPPAEGLTCPICSAQVKRGRFRCLFAISKMLARRLARCAKRCGARSRLYRSQILQVNMRLKGRKEGRKDHTCKP